MAKKYMDWADWAGNNPELAEAELRASKQRLIDKHIELEALIGGNCEHAEVDNQGVCENCATEVEGWEPDETQLDQHHGTSVAA